MDENCNKEVDSIEIVNPLECPQWDQSFLSGGEYSFYHSQAWAIVLMKTYGYTPRYVVIYREGSSVGLIPFMEIRSIFTGKRGVSLPFSDYSAPIIPEGPEFCSVLKKILPYAQKAGWKYFEIRGGSVASERMNVSKAYYVHTLMLSEDEHEMLEKMKNTTKRNIKKAIKEKVIVEKYNSKHAMKAFYRLNCITRKKHGLPPQPESFYDRIYEYIVSQGKGHIFLAKYMEKIIAGAVYFHMGRKAIYKYGASDPIYLNVRANNLVMWEAIKWYGCNGFSTLCLGRTESHNKGLLRFKSGWGSKQTLVNYFKYNLKDHEFVLSDSRETGLHTIILKRMPVGLLKIIGALVYKHIG